MSDEEIEEALRRCNTDPIHTPQFIQPFGALLGYELKSNTIVLYSENLTEFLGLEQAIKLDTKIDDYKELAPFSPDIAEKNGDTPKEIIFKGRIVRIIQKGDIVVAEFQKEDSEDSPLSHTVFIEKISDAILDSNNIDEIFSVSLDAIREYTGYDRVMLYKFDKNFDGEVLCESKSDSIESFLGHTFPASDIPESARRLYEKSPVRLIESVKNIAVRVLAKETIPSLNPLDMSFIHSRGVAPIHVEYLENMSVAGSMSISIVVRGRLWGLIACHDNTSKYISLERRMWCERAAKIVSGAIENREISEINTLQNTKIAALSYLYEHLDDEINNRLFMLNDANVKKLLLMIIEAKGVAIISKANISLYGIDIAKEQIQKILDNVKSKINEDVYFCNSLAALNPTFEKIKRKISGVLILRIDKENFIIWLRPEMQKNIAWAGQPIKKLYTKNGELHISPRKSFETWNQAVNLRCEEWSGEDIAYARKIKKFFFKERLKVVSDEQGEGKAVFLSNDRITQVFSVMPQSVIITDIDGVIAYANEAFLKRTGYEKNEVVGKNANILKSGMHERSFYADMWANILALKVWRGRVTNRTKAGELYQVDVTIAPIVDENGDIVAFVAVEHEMTEFADELARQQKLHEDYKEEMRQKDLNEHEVRAIEDANMKHRIKKELLMQIAHHWRQPITVLGMLVEDVRTAYENDAIDDAFVEKFEKDTLSLIEDMSEKITAFSGYFKPEGYKSDFYPSAVIEETLAALKPSFSEKNISFKSTLEYEGTVYGFKSALSRIIIEIMNNILDVVVVRRLASADVSVTTFLAGDFLVIEVSDNCGGIEDLDAVFDPYYSTKKSLNNVGLGLFAVKTILTEHFGGSIDAQNTTLGAKFTMKIDTRRGE